MLNKNVEKVYEPDGQIKLSYFSLWQEMIKEIFVSRWLIWRLFLRDFRAKYKQAVFGMLWAVIMPIVMICVFVFLNRADFDFRVRQNILHWFF